ncbi:Uncharacterized protein DBV15_08164 [Temnothorax longispinosus]|uniref:Uncharacterized protein n=1 Tax=Temnothorax longispinosus TaxID=300112 RepID=A0A4S2KBC3_9HYME|nr:Uncharacterized protein DBV15_08164 [Temnothorax longispinosus]
MPADTPPISEHQLCSTPSLCSTLVARSRTILKSNGPRHAATTSIPKLSNLRDQFSASSFSLARSRSDGTVSAFLQGVTYPGGGRRGDDGRRYIGIPKPKRISNVYVSSFIVDFVLFSPSSFSRRRTSFCLSLLVVGQTSHRHATRSIADVEDVIDVLSA